MKFFALTSIYFLLIYFQVEAQASRKVFRISSIKDSIVLVGTGPFYDGVQIFRGKKIFDSSNNRIVIKGNEPHWFTEYRNLPDHFYIIRIYNAPDPSRFLIIKTSSDQTYALGITEPNSADIFGDVDYDGKFEIGGLTMFCQGGDNDCHPADHYHVFEIAPNFPTDISLSNFFKLFLKQ